MRVVRTKLHWSLIRLVIVSFFACAVSLKLYVNHLLAQPAAQSSLQVITQVPLEIVRSRVSLEVMVNGRGPFRFGLDTGASGDAWVTQALVDTLRLPVVNRLQVSDGTGLNPRSVDRVQIDTMTLGNVSFKQLTAPVLGEGPKQLGDPEVYGVIGFELFDDYVVTYDYPGKALRIAKGALPVPNDNNVLSYTLDLGSPRVLIDIAGLRLTAEIDTGNVGGILLPLGLAEKLPLRAPLRQVGRVASAFNAFDLYQSELNGNVQIGSATIVNPALFFSDRVREANLGRDVLRMFAVTFDQKNSRVQFQPASQ